MTAGEEKQEGNWKPCNLQVKLYRSSQFCIKNCISADCFSVMKSKKTYHPPSMSPRARRNYFMDVIFHSQDSGGSRKLQRQVRWKESAVTPGGSSADKLLDCNRHFMDLSVGFLQAQDPDLNADALVFFWMPKRLVSSQLQRWDKWLFSLRSFDLACKKRKEKCKFFFNSF